MCCICISSEAGGIQSQVLWMRCILMLRANGRGQGCPLASGHVSAELMRPCSHMVTYSNPTLTPSHFCDPITKNHIKRSHANTSKCGLWYAKKFGKPCSSLSENSSLFKTYVCFIYQSVRACQSTQFLESPLCDIHRAIHLEFRF